MIFLIIITEQQPDVVVWFKERKNCIIFELTQCFERRTLIHLEDYYNKYTGLIRSAKRRARWLENREMRSRIYKTQSKELPIEYG